MIDDWCVDLLYLAYNRLEFTQETFTALLANTDWRYVHELFVYDDGSQDGTREWLEDNVRNAPVSTRFVKTQFGSPVTAMVHFIESASAPILGKTDNDAMLPPAWLRQSLEVLEHHSELSLLGIEAMYPHSDDVNLVRSYTPAVFISGLGLYRRSAFAGSRPKMIDKWFGLEEWQTAQGASLVRGWITPALPVFLLDRFPFEPWATYSAAYVTRGWQRVWPKYDRMCTLWRWRWADQASPIPAIAAAHVTAYSVLPDGNPVQGHDRFGGNESPKFKIVILSRRALNLVACVRSLLANEPGLPPDHIIVVDDGARREAAPELPPIRWVEGIKPFVFARNANLGIREAGTDVVLLNDDARLLTPRGLTLLSRHVQENPPIGLCSAGIQGAVGNPRQITTGRSQYRQEGSTLAFICIYIPKSVYYSVGPLDERFTGYGFEDNDYCARVLGSGLQLGIWDGCVVDHSGELPSTFRTHSDVWVLFERNRKLFHEKWGRSA
jgi:GT2 family glycosyltransferase